MLRIDNLTINQMHILCSSMYLYSALLFTGVTLKGVTGLIIEFALIHTCLLAITKESNRQSSPEENNVGT